jgi:hypothetical protein
VSDNLCSTMAKNDLRCAHFVAVTPARATRLLSDASTVAGLREGEREETGLDRYWHGVQHLLAGRAKGVRGPLRAPWLPLSRAAPRAEPASVPAGSSPPAPGLSPGGSRPG